MKVYIVRHGETDWNLKWKLQGQTDTELNDYGRELAFKTAEGLKDVCFDRIFSSPLKRAYDTADIIRRDRKIPVETDRRLCEVGFGINEGKLPEEREPSCKLFFTAPHLYVPSEGGETLTSLCERTGDFVDKVLRPMSLEKPDSCVLISGHGAMNKGLMLNLKKHGLENFWDGALQHNCSVNIYELNGEHCTVIEEGLLFYEPDESRRK